MAYVKRNIPNGHKLTAEDLAHLETGIDGAHVAIENIDVGVTTVNGMTGDVTISGDGTAVDLTGYATETYVDDAVASVDTMTDAEVTASIGRYEGTNGGDDTAALQAAINDAATAGRPLTLSRMFYVVHATITLPTGLVLDGNGALIQGVAGLNTHVVTNADMVGGNTNITVRNLRVDGNAANQTLAMNPFRLDGVTHSEFINLDCQGGRRGMDAQMNHGSGLSMSNCYHNKVSGGHFHHNYYDGIKLRTSSYNKFSDISCTDNYRSGIQLSYTRGTDREGSFEAGSNYNEFTNIVVTHSDGVVQGGWIPTTTGLYIHTGAFNTFTNFQIYGPQQGIGVWAGSNDNTWTNGVIRTRWADRSRSPIDMEGGPTMPSHRNTFRDIEISPLSGADGKYIRVTSGSTGHRFFNVKMKLGDGTGVWTVDDAGTDTLLRDCVKDGVAIGGSAGGSSTTSGIAHLSAFNGATGAVPYGWSPRWGQASSTWTEDAGGFLRLVKAATGRTAIANVVAGDFGDTEVLVKVRTTSTAAGDTALGVVLRGGGTAGAEHGYFVTVADAGTKVNITRYNQGATATLKVITVSWAPNAWYWMRVRVSGTTNVLVRSKFWADGATEPATWDDYTDSTVDRVTSPGWAGLGNFSAVTSDFEDFTITRL